MKYRKITTILILSTVFMGFYLTMNINLSTPESSISKTLNLSGQDGDVWFSSVSTQTVGDTFETEIYVNTSSRKLGAYGFDIAYNESVIQIANVNDVVAGAEGFVSVVNLHNGDGLVTIAGFEAMGTGPSFQLHLLTITWTAVGAGSSPLDLSILDLADTIIETIGTPTDIDGSVVVEGGPAQAPVLNSLSDVYYQESTTGHSITWTATDDNPTTYTVTQDGTQVASGSWSSGVGITVSVDDLSEGSYNYTCTVNDGDGLSDSDSVTVNVTVDPVIGGDVWFSSVSTQTVGDTFETEIYVNTGSQNLNLYAFIIAYNESVIQIASNNDIEAGNEGFVSMVSIDNDNGLVEIAGYATCTGLGSQLHLLTITWTAFGAGISSLDLTIDDLQDSDTDTIGTPNDIDGSVEVEGAPTQAPVLHQEGTTGNSITWIATDDNPTTYTITQNGTIVARGSWSSGVEITVSIDGLSDGYWIINCTVYDGDGLYDSDTVNIKVTSTAVGDVWFSSVSTQTVGDTFETEIYVNTGSQNLAAYGFDIAYNEDVIQIASDNDVEAGSEGFVSAVNIDNDNGLVTIAGFEATGTGPSSQLHLLTITWTAVGAGSTSLDLSILDLADTMIETIGTPNAIDGSVEVEGAPTQAPVLNSPSNVNYVEGDTGNSITWTATDDNPTTYTIIQNGSQVASDFWSSGNAITINVDGLSPGLYIYTITVYDGSGNNATDSVYVIVNKVIHGGGEIPGYDLFIFLGSLWITVLTMINLRKRRQ